MTRQIVIPLPAGVRVAPVSGESRPRYLYVDGRRTDTPMLDERGRALQSWDGIAEVGGERVPVTVSSPVPLPADLPLGAILVSTGTARLTCSNSRDSWDLRVGLTLDGFEAAK